MKIPAKILDGDYGIGAVTHAQEFNLTRQEAVFSGQNIHYPIYYRCILRRYFWFNYLHRYPDNILIVIPVTATGSFLGLTGLNKITSAIPDILISFLSRFK